MLGSIVAYCVRSLRRAYRSFIVVQLRSRARQTGDHVRVEGRIRVGSPGHLTIGNNVHLGSGFFANCKGGLTIGDNVVIANNCSIMTVSHDFETPDALPYGTRDMHGPVIIEDNVWIGINVNITPGVRIGEGAVVGMGAVVTRDVPPLSVVGGNPARVIKTRDATTYNRLKEEQKYLGHIRGYEVERELSRYNRHLVNVLTQNGRVTEQDCPGSSHLVRALLYAFALRHGLLFREILGGYEVVKET